jgi:hypothetical protein
MLTMLTMALVALLVVIGARKPTSTHTRMPEPMHTQERTHVRACVSAQAQTLTQAHECMQPPAQVVLTFFVCPATLIDLTTMVQATSDHSVAVTFTNPPLQSAPNALASQRGQPCRRSNLASDAVRSCDSHAGPGPP